MITGTCSIELGLSISITSGNGIASAEMGLDISPSGYIPIVGVASAELGMSLAFGGIIGDASAEMGMSCFAEGVVGIIGDASAEMGLSVHGAGFIGILGEASVELCPDVTPAGYITIVGSMSAELGLNMWAMGYIQALIIEAGYQAGVVNTKTHGPALYTNFPINSLFELLGEQYGCSDNGIEQLTGTKDNGADIQTRIRSGISDYNASTAKRYPTAKIIGRCEGLMELAVIVDERKEVVYEVSAWEGRQGIHAKRVQLAKGVKGHSVQWELRNVQGSDPDIKALEMYPEYLRRTY